MVWNKETVDGKHVVHELLNFLVVVLKRQGAEKTLRGWQSVFVFCPFWANVVLNCPLWFYGLWDLILEDSQRKRW